MLIPEAMCGPLADLLLEAVQSRVAGERSRLARPGERSFFAAPWLELVAQLRAASESATASESGTGSFTPRLLTVDDYAQAAGITPRQARNRCRSGAVPGARLHSGRWLIVAEGEPG